AKSIGVDPAVFSNPFISTFVDATGLILYFLIAKAILGI
ncbi:magnesium transporter, partial [Tsukamurella tyrosinosolvens]